MVQRLFYLDALRSFSMVFGVFVHANVFFLDRPFPAIPMVSEYFRMATFFLVSGFLAALVSEHTSRKKFIINRVQALFIPLLVCMLLLNPITNYLVYIQFNDPVSLKDYFISGTWRLPAAGPGSAFLHLWFLFSLLLFVLLSGAMRWLANSRVSHGFARILIALSPGVMLACLALVIATIVVMGRILFEAGLAFAFEGTPFGFVVRISLTYMPYFFTGIFIFYHREIFERFHQVNIPLLLCALAIVVALDHAEIYLPRQIGTALEIMARALLTTALIAGLLWVFRRYADTDNKLVRTAMQAMYSVYLFHYGLIFLSGYLLKDIIRNEPLLYITLVAIALGFGLLIHRTLIRRYALMTYLFNGRSTPIKKDQSVIPRLP